MSKKTILLILMLIIPTIVIFLLSDTAAVDEHKLKFDFGPIESPVESGYRRVSKWTGGPLDEYMWDYGWVYYPDDNPLSGLDRGAPDNLRRDFIFSSEEGIFYVELPKGDYIVTVIIGDNDYGHDNIDVYVQDVLKVDDVSVSAGNFEELTFSTTVVTDYSLLYIRFNDDGGSDQIWVLNAMTIEKLLPPADSYRFDFGTFDSPVESGYTRVHEWDLSPCDFWDYGWIRGPGFYLRSLDRGAPDNLRGDFVYGAHDIHYSPYDFRVALRDGTYIVTMIIGDNNYLNDNIDIYVQDVLKVDDVSVSAGNFEELTFSLTVTDGQLIMGFDDDGGSDPYWSVNALEITDVYNFLKIVIEDHAREHVNEEYLSISLGCQDPLTGELLWTFDGQFVGQPLGGRKIEYNIPFSVTEILPSNEEISLYVEATGHPPPEATDWSGKITEFSVTCLGETFTSSDPPVDITISDPGVASVVFRTPPHVLTSTGTGKAAFSSSSGTIESLSAIDEATLPVEGRPAGISFPDGLFSFTIADLTPGETVKICMELPTSVSVGSEYWKCHVDGTPQWFSIPIGSDDGDNIVYIQLTDGGIGDSDGVANGEIVDPGGPGLIIPSDDFPWEIILLAAVSIAIIIAITIFFHQEEGINSISSMRAIHIEIAGFSLQ
ncbi:MAG: choice-of-anchor U domain-containing protein [Candidatus Hodarchaeota archaeon]